MLDNLIISEFGAKGSGKTELAKKIAALFRRVMVIDSLGEYAEGATICRTLSDAFETMLRVHRFNRFKLCFQFSDVTDYLLVFKLAYEIPNSLVLVEETSLFCSPMSLPVELSQLVRYGRHRQISQLYIARRPSEIHRDLTAQSDVIVSFRQREPRDIAYLSQVSGEDASEVRTLPKYRCVAWGDPAKILKPIRAQLVKKSQGELFEGGESE